MSDIQFDLSRITVRELTPYLGKMDRLHVSWLPEIMPLLVTACPFGAADDPATYDLPLFGNEMKQLWQGYQAAIKQANAAPAITFASFDLSAIRAKDFDAIVDDINGTKVDVIASILAKYVSKCPEVRNIGEPGAYLDLVYYTQFRPLANKLSRAAQEQMENFLKQSDGS